MLHRRGALRRATFLGAALLMMPLVGCAAHASGDTAAPAPTSLTAPPQPSSAGPTGRTQETTAPGSDSSGPDSPGSDSPGSDFPGPHDTQSDDQGSDDAKPDDQSDDQRGRGRRPNILFISTDDQADYDLRWMPNTRRLLAAQGVSFSDFVAPHPLCCPSRAMMLTGQYAQNNGVRHNEGPYGGYKRLDPEHTIATWLHEAGYQTAFVGKYLNGYEHKRRGPEPGWDVWNPTIQGVYRYYGYKMYNDGHPRYYPDIHNADLVGAKTVDYIKRFARTDKPFFIWASQVAPHGACVPSQELTCWAPPKPARRHALMFSDVIPPSMSDPSYNEADVSDKPRYIREKAPVGAANMRDYFVSRIQSLQAVDDGVARAVDTLRRTGELDNTLIVFTSDNGYLLGEHRLATKNVGYEQALQVPLLVRGPGIPRGVARNTAGGTLDLAPTFLEAAHAEADITMDGLSLLPAARHDAGIDRDTMLLQSGPVTAVDLPFGWFYRGVRTARYTYLYYPSSAEAELYDRQRDPHQLTNVSGDRRYRAVEAELAARVDALGSCNGDECRQTFGPVPAPQSE